MTSKLDTAGLVERLEGFGKAYPEKAFPPVTDEERLWLMRARPGLLDRISADMGRHFAKFATQAAEALTQAAAPDMAPVAWRCHDLILPGDASIIDDLEHAQARMRQADAWKVEPLYSASQLSALQERAERAERERNEVHQVASKLTKALVGLTRGGSEYFTRCEALDDYFADVDQCVRVIRERFDTGHQAKIERLNERRRAEAAEARVAELEKQRDEARHELWETGLALGVIAKWPRVYFNRFYVEEWVLRTVTILKRWGVEFADGPLSVEGSRSIRNSRLSRAALAHKGE